MTLVFACAAMLVSYLPFSAVNGVLGTIGTATGAGTGDLQWVTDAFTVALVGAVLSAGVLGDLYGRKRVALAGLGLTVVSTVTGFIAGGLHGAAGIHLLWLGQAAGGLGAGMVM
jgi:MFS family permease